MRRIEARLRLEQWRSLGERWESWLVPLTSLLVLMGFFGLLQPRFLGYENLSTVALQSAVGGILAIAETLLIITGAIDLSVGSVVALSGVVAGLLLREGASAPVGVLVGIGVGTACGFVSGFVTVKARIHSFIVTLGMMGIARGLALQLSEAVTVQWTNPTFASLGTAQYAGLALPVWVLIGVAAGMALFLNRTVAGRYAYAIGSNVEATRLSGVPVGRYQIAYFTLAGALTGLAGILLAARTGVSQPTAAEGDELKAIAASVIGGASLMGGQGHVPGALIGTFLMEILRNGCNLQGVSVHWQKVVIGALIVLAVLYDRWRRKDRR